MLAGQREEMLAGVGLHVGCVDDRQVAGGQPLAGDEVQQLERRAGRRLVRFIVGHQAATDVAGHRFVPAEVPGGERGLAGPGGADQDDERQFRTRQYAGHVCSFTVNTAACVGGPTSG